MEQFRQSLSSTIREDGVSNSGDWISHKTLGNVETMMDWNLVKKMTLWDYEELITKISEVFSYNFIRVHYNHSMMEATGYVRKLLGYDMKYAEYVNRMTSTFESRAR